MHQLILNSRVEDVDTQDFDKVEENINREIGELQTISDTLFTKTPFGLTLQEMYANSAKIGKNSNDYVLYKLMLKNKDLMAMNYDEMSSTLRLIKDKNKAELYYRYIELKQNNPLIDHIKPKVDIHTINQTKTYLREITQKNIVPFDTARHPHARQLMVYMLENDVENVEDMKLLVEMISKNENKGLHKGLFWSKIFFPAYPFVKSKVNKKEEEIKENFNKTLEDIQGYIKEYSLLNKVLDRKGYLMAIDNIINGNAIFLKLLLNALNDYLEIRDVNNALSNLTDEERIILNFAYENSKTARQYKEIVDKILSLRVYYETLKYEELY